MNLWNPLNLFAKAGTVPGAKPPVVKGGAIPAGGALPPMTALPAMPLVLTPKVVNKQQTIPSYVPSTAYIAAPLQRKDISAQNIDISETARLGATTPDVIRALARLNPDLSAALSAYLRVGIPEKYRAIARNMDGSINREATQLAMSIIRQLDLMPDYAVEFSAVSSFRSLSESLAKEIILEGSCALELVLDKNRMPFKLQPIASKQIIFRENKDTQHLLMQQYISGTYIDLNIPTAFYVSLDQDLLTPYSISPFEGAVQPVLAASSFLQDMRRICQRQVFPRYDIELDEIKLRTHIPPEILNDTVACDNYLNGVIAAAQTVINNMAPEEALVHFDFLKVKYVEGASSDNSKSFETVKSIYDEKISTGAKTLPSILGHGSGSQNVASSETLVFMLSANGMIRLKLQEIYSRVFTLAVRLFGQDVTVEFKFDDINLRPTLELEAFKNMKQARILELLSLGFMEDDMAALELTGDVTPQGFAPLSGTGFYTTTTASGQPDPGSEEGPSDPSMGDPKKLDPKKANPMGNKQGTLNQSLKPKTPTTVSGPQK